MIEQLKSQIIKANDAYRIGKPIISDAKYDQLVEELQSLSPNDELLSKVGHVITDESRKSKLPIEMASMNKIKSIEDINDWCRLKGISKSEYVFHLAAAVGVFNIVRKPLDSLLINIRGTENVLELANNYRIPVLVTSSSEVYGKNSKDSLIYLWKRLWV